MSTFRINLSDQAREDIRRSEEFTVYPWNETCPHSVTNEQVQESFLHCVSPASWGSLKDKDFAMMRRVCRCCLRFVPQWPLLVAESLEACFRFPDDISRGLLWRCVIFTVKMNDRLPFKVRDQVLRKLAIHLQVPVGFEQGVAECFLGAVASACTVTLPGQKKT